MSSESQSLFFSQKLFGLTLVMLLNIAIVKQRMTIPVANQVSGVGGTSPDFFLGLPLCDRLGGSSHFIGVPKVAL